MKIAFWSNASGRAGTTSNLACISIICSIMEQKRAILFENHFNLNGLEQALVNYKRNHQNILREEFAYYDQTGLEGLIRRVHSNHTYKEIMEDVSLKFLDNLIYYLPKNGNLNQEYFEFELNQVIQPLLSFLDESFDCVFIDTAFNQSLSTKSILEEAELVVVNLCQNKAVLDHFFANYRSLVDKSIFLIGNYHSQSRYNLKNIRRRYQIPKEIIGVIPFNLEFADAVSNGSAIEFLMRNFTCGRQDENYFFMNEAKKSADMILRYMDRGVAQVVS